MAPKERHSEAARRLDLRDPRLIRCLLKIQSMDEGSRVMVVDTIEAIVNAYAMLFERDGPEGAR